MNLWSVRVLLPPSFSGPLVPASKYCNLYESSNSLFQYLASRILVVAFRMHWLLSSMGERERVSRGRGGEGRREIAVWELPYTVSAGATTRESKSRFN